MAPMSCPRGTNVGWAVSSAFSIEGGNRRPGVTAVDISGGFSCMMMPQAPGLSPANASMPRRQSMCSSSSIARSKSGPDLLLAILLLEHIDWRRGIEAFAGLRPGACGIIMQENPPEMSTAVTPGRRLPPSIEKALETAHPTLVRRGQLIGAMAEKGYALRDTAVRQVPDGKRLVGLLFRRASLTDGTDPVGRDTGEEIGRAHV